MATNTLGAWTLWFLMLVIYSIIIIAAFFLCTTGVAWYTARLNGRPTLVFRFSENGKETMVYVYNHEHWLVRAIVDNLVARKTKIEDLQAQNEQPGGLNDNLESKLQV